jgi:hypothetical protein
MPLADGGTAMNFNNPAALGFDVEEYADTRAFHGLTWK